MSHFAAHARPRLGLFACVLLACGLAVYVSSAPPACADEEEAGRGAPSVQVGLVLQGRLRTTTRTEDGVKKTLYQIRVGATEYEIDTGSVEVQALRKAKGRYVTIRAEPQNAVAEGETGIVLEEDATFSVQDGGPLVGIVRDTGPGKKNGYVLETSDGSWAIAARDARRFRGFVDLQVAVTCFQVTDGRFRALEKVKKVTRRLRPGERAPTSGAEAIGASWRGVLTAVKVPKGIPGVEPGDFALSFRTDATQEATEGRVMDAYDVVGTRVRKFNHKKRSARIELAYSFGQGSYAILLEGTFSRDWKHFEGEWKSGFLGSGTFRLTVSES